MAIFTAEEYGRAIQRCLLNGKDVTRFTACVGIPSITIASVHMPPLTGALRGVGWADIFATDDEGHIVVGADGAPVLLRHYGIVELEWGKGATLREAGGE